MSRTRVAGQRAVAARPPTRRRRLQESSVDDRPQERARLVNNPEAPASRAGSRGRRLEISARCTGSGNRRVPGQGLAEVKHRPSRCRGQGVRTPSRRARTTVASMATSGPDGSARAAPPSARWLAVPGPHSQVRFDGSAAGHSRPRRHDRRRCEKVRGRLQGLRHQEPAGRRPAPGSPRWSRLTGSPSVSSMPNTFPVAVELPPEALDRRLGEPGFDLLPLALRRYGSMRCPSAR